jgi:hypothetical protein
VLLTALPEASVFAPRGLARSYSNHGEEVARMLIISSPGTENDRGLAHETRIAGPPLEV